METAMFKKDDIVFAIFRIAIGLLFLQHGVQKLFGWLGGIDGQGMAAPAFNMFWWAGIIETAVGLGLALGLFTRGLALLGTLEMGAAYFFIMHLPQGFFPILNQGELALLYFFSFILILSRSTHVCSVDMIASRRSQKQPAPPPA